MWPILAQIIDEMAEALVALISTFVVVGFIVGIALTIVLLGYSGGND